MTEKEVEPECKKMDVKYHRSRLVIKSLVRSVFGQKITPHGVGGDQNPRSIFGPKCYPRVSKVLMVAKSPEVLLSHIQKRKKGSGGGMV